jgi:hypothetical protein
MQPELTLADWNGRKLFAGLKTNLWAGHWWLTPIILATQEAEIRKIIVQTQPRQVIFKTLSQKKKKKRPTTHTNKGWWSGLRCRPWVQALVLEKKKKLVLESIHLQQGGSKNFRNSLSVAVTGMNEFWPFKHVSLFTCQSSVRKLRTYGGAHSLNVLGPTGRCSELFRVSVAEGLPPVSAVPPRLHTHRGERPFPQKESGYS